MKKIILLMILATVIFFVKQSTSNAIEYKFKDGKHRYQTIIKLNYNMPFGPLILNFKNETIIDFLQEVKISKDGIKIIESVQRIKILNITPSEEEIIDSDQKDKLKKYPKMVNGDFKKPFSFFVDSSGSVSNLQDFSENNFDCLKYNKFFKNLLKKQQLKTLLNIDILESINDKKKYGNIVDDVIKNNGKVKVKLKNKMGEIDLDPNSGIIDDVCIFLKDSKKVNVSGQDLELNFEYNISIRLIK